MIAATCTVIAKQKHCPHLSRTVRVIDGVRWYYCLHCGKRWLPGKDEAQ